MSKKCTPEEYEQQQEKIAADGTLYVAGYFAGQRRGCEEGLEQAAKVCDKNAEEWQRWSDTQGLPLICAEGVTCINNAADIRELKKEVGDGD